MLIWIPFPPGRPVTAQTMNYAGPLFLAVIVFALLDWCTTGRKRFVVPTGAVALPEDDKEIEDAADS